MEKSAPNQFSLKTDSNTTSQGNGITANQSSTIQIREPVKDKQRIEILDIIRGVAVLGILLMNIWVFGMYPMGEPLLEMISDKSGLNFWTYQIIIIFFEGKMRALFCMLFGAGIMLFITQKKIPGKKGLWRLFYFRMFWLVLFGLAQAHLLLWMGDILYFYGLFGMVVYLLHKMKPKYKVLGVPIVAVIGFVMGILFFQNIRNQKLNYLDAQQAKVENQELSESQNEAITKWNKTRAVFYPDFEIANENIEKMRGSYSEVASEVRPFAWMIETQMVFMMLGDNVALMLLGMALLQWGFIIGKWSNRQYKLVVIIGYSVGLPLVIVSAYHNAMNYSSLEDTFQYMQEHPIDWFALIYPFQRIFLVMAHTSLLVLIIKGGYLNALMKRLKAVGQMAFTNYILQTIICTLFFFGYGLGYYQHLELYQLYFVVLAVWLFEIIISPIWLKHFRFGPLEWLWRSLTYWKIQPMRR